MKMMQYMVVKCPYHYLETFITGYGMIAFQAYFGFSGKSDRLRRNY